MKKHYLLKCTTMFFDGHGCGSDGGIILSVVSGKTYDRLNPRQEYIYNEEYDSDEEGSEEYIIDDNEDGRGAEDGYNCTEEFYTIKEISMAEAVRYKKAIKAYNKLIDLV